MRIQFYTDLRGEFRWRLVASNGRIMADSAEGYVSEAGRQKAVDTLLKSFSNGSVRIEE